MTVVGDQVFCTQCRVLVGYIDEYDIAWLNNVRLLSFTPYNINSRGNKQVVCMKVSDIGIHKRRYVTDNIDLLDEPPYKRQKFEQVITVMNASRNVRNFPFDDELVFLPSPTGLILARPDEPNDYDSDISDYEDTEDSSEDEYMSEFSPHSDLIGNLSPYIPSPYLASPRLMSPVNFEHDDFLGDGLACMCLCTNPNLYIVQCIAFSFCVIYLLLSHHFSIVNDYDGYDGYDSAGEERVSSPLSDYTLETPDIFSMDTRQFPDVDSMVRYILNDEILPELTGEDLEFMDEFDQILDDHFDEL